MKKKRCFLFGLAGVAAAAAVWIWCKDSQSAATAASTGRVLPQAASLSASPAASAHIVRVSDVSVDQSTDIDDADADPDSLREDIAAEIRRRYPEPAHQQALLQFARAQQMFLRLGSSPSGARRSIERIDRSIACLRQIAATTYLNDANQVTAMMLDTREQFAAYVRATENLAGQAVDGYQGDHPCE